jgi:hypothetical protein
MTFFKNQLPIGVTFVAAFIIVAQYYLNIASWKTLAAELLRWNVVLAAFALALGIGGIVRLHWGRISRRAPETPYSIICLATLALFLGVGFAQTTRGTTYQWLWDYILLPVQATSYATTFFFITSAAYRAFRIKNGFTLVLMVSAILMMLRVGFFAAFMPFTPNIAAWVWDIPTTAGMRAVVIGGALSVVGNSFRVIVGLERGHLGGGE